MEPHGVIEPLAGETMTFGAFVADPLLLAALKSLNIETPTPVQREALPPALGGNDLIVQARTGSGKTLAFVIPFLLRHLPAAAQGDTAGIIITPTRELATQIWQVVGQVSRALKPVCLIGGVSLHPQVQSLRADCRLVVGTPGRILDLLRQRELLLNKCRYFVVDEADEMFSMDFVEDVRAILSRLPRERQGIFASATITPRVEALANNFLKEPRKVIISSPGEELPPIEHCYCEVSGEVTAKVSALCDLIETLNPRSAIVFANTRSDTELVEVFLRRRGFDARRINSDLNQRQREYVMSKIKNGGLRFLVGTDIAARGIDIAELDMVINYALPEQPEMYVHRTGRTARAGRNGRALSLIGPQDFAAFVSLKRYVSLPLNKIGLPSEEEVVSARLAHFYELLRSVPGEATRRDVLMARKLLGDMLAADNPPDEACGLLARLVRSTIERLVNQETLSLEDEMKTQGAAQSEAAPTRSRRGEKGSAASRRKGRGGSRRNFERRGRR